MNKEEEIEYYRRNIIRPYVEAVEIQLQNEELQPKYRVVSHKRCDTCRKLKPLREFYPNRAASYGVDNTCEECALKKYKRLRSFS